MLLWLIVIKPTTFAGSCISRNGALKRLFFAEVVVAEPVADSSSENTSNSVDEYVTTRVFEHKTKVTTRKDNSSRNAVEMAMIAVSLNDMKTVQIVVSVMDEFCSSSRCPLK